MATWEHIFKKIVNNYLTFLLVSEEARGNILSKNGFFNVYDGSYA